MKSKPPPQTVRDTQGLLQRILWLDAELRAQRHPNIAALMEYWEISRRSAFNTVAYLRDSLGAPMEYHRKRRGYSYADATYALPTVFLAEGELLALVLAEEASRQYLGTSLECALRGAVEKLCRFLPAEVQVDLELLGEQFHFAGGSTLEVPLRLLAEVRQAIRECRPLRILYYTASRDELRERVIEPHFLQNVRGDWLVAAWDRWRDADRVFMLARIREWTLLDSGFRRRPELSPERYTADQFLLERGTETEEVVLRFDAYQARWIRERRWHPTQVLDEQPDGGVLLRMTVRGEGDLTRWILGYGSHVEVLGPAWLRERVAAEVCAAVATYSSART